ADGARVAGRPDAATSSAVATDSWVDAPGGPGRDQLDPARIRTVDVELIWTRFENDGPALLVPERDAADATLGFSMVISGPEADLLARPAEFPGGAEILRTLIDLFERLREQKAMVASRSRIEDGRFVGWLSYPDVLAAQDAVLPLRETFRTAG